MSPPSLHYTVPRMPVHHARSEACGARFYNRRPVGRSWRQALNARSSIIGQGSPVGVEAAAAPPPDTRAISTSPTGEHGGVASSSGESRLGPWAHTSAGAIVCPSARTLGVGARPHRVTSVSCHACARACHDCVCVPRWVRLWSVPCLVCLLVSVSASKG